jgi:molecular chaperone DnaK
MKTTQSVGIDLGTTYSCIAYLNKHGEPVTLPNQEGELSTPSVVLFDGEDAVVGTEALRNAILHPDKVVKNSKRFMGNARHRWTINGKPYTPVDIATFILKKLISTAQQQIGPIEQAVITVPAQFSDAQRHATMEAGHRAGLQKVDIINEPVAAALCYVLGSEGIWFTELADQQRIMVYDLGGGTFDLSLVMYEKEEVSVIASSGDLMLGGIDWNLALEQHVAEMFANEFGKDPRGNSTSMQYLSLEAEQTKRSLSVRPRAAMACQHAGHRKTYQIDQTKFEELTQSLVEHTSDITRRMLIDNDMGWAHVDVVLTTGGASRMPMIRNKMKELSGTTLNTSLSPDLSIAHGATYYAGMLLTNDKFAKSILDKEASRRLAALKQKSVNARALGIMAKDPRTGGRVPHFFLPANTPIPADVTNNYGTVIPDQKRVHLQIVESGTSPEKPPTILGNCIIEGLPPHLPVGSEIAVTISYDSQARVHVSAKDVTSGKRATTEIVRSENVVPQLASDHLEEDLILLPDDSGVGMEKIEQAKKEAEKLLPEKPVVKKPAVKSPPKKSPVASQPGTASASPAALSKPQVKPKPVASPQAKPQPVPKKKVAVRPAPKPKPKPIPQAKPADTLANQKRLEGADQPVPLCNECGEPLNSRGQCTSCSPAPARKKTGRKPVRSGGAKRPPQKKRPTNTRGGKLPQMPLNDDDILDLIDETPTPRKAPAASPTRQPASRKPRVKQPPVPKRPVKKVPPKKKPQKDGEDEFWDLVDD